MGAQMRRGKQMKQDIGAVAHRLAEDHRLSDYDFWRALKNLDSEIYRKAGDHQPIPIEMIRWRAIIKQARSRRGMGRVRRRAYPRRPTEEASTTSPEVWRLARWPRCYRDAR